MGLVPAAVIGDFDSISPAVAAALPKAIMHRVDEQETIDFEKALTRIGAPFVLGVGFLGARIDHTLATLSALVRMRDRRCLLIGSDDVIFAATDEVSLNLPLGSRLSLFPMDAVTGRSDGLRWPIEEIAFAPAGRVGTSNKVTGPVHLAFDGPGMLVILPRAALAPALAAFRG
jgi:thiamine pyrophosphokinase